MFQKRKKKQKKNIDLIRIRTHTQLKHMENYIQQEQHTVTF